MVFVSDQVRWAVRGDLRLDECSRTSGKDSLCHRVDLAACLGRGPKHGSIQPEMFRG
jgi:hypothetical protein